MHPPKKPVVLITAGPTREYIDPVRFITNASSGLMGYMIAGCAGRANARVILVSGPTHLIAPKNVKTIYVNTTKEMYGVARKYFPEADISIFSAAVSDFRLKKIFKNKLKVRTLNLHLTRNIDILSSLTGMSCRKKKIVVGFAVETENLMANALNKLKSKNLDFIVANPVQSIGSKNTSGFIINKNSHIIKIPPLTKQRLAKFIWKYIETLYMKPR